MHVAQQDSTPLLEAMSKIYPKKAHSVVKVSDLVEDRGFQRIVYVNTDNPSSGGESLLIISSIGNERSFGASRTFKDFFTTIQTLDYDPKMVNFGFNCASQNLFDSIIAFFDEFIQSETPFPYGRVTVTYASFMGESFSRSSHAPRVQRARRRSIARARNFAIANSLINEKYTLFLDADIVNFVNTDMVRYFVNSGKDIIVPRITRGSDIDYDKNSWRGQRVLPSARDYEIMDKNRWESFKFVPHDETDRMFHLRDHYMLVETLDQSDPKRSLDYLEELDSVGGAVLFAKSVIYQQGIQFPVLNIIGTTWGRLEGFDGIETEGLCYMARVLGYRCYAMPNLVAQHYHRTLLN